jgi:hypothetical protein
LENREKQIFLKVFGLNYIIKVIGEVPRCVDWRFNVLLLETPLKIGQMVFQKKLN